MGKISIAKRLNIYRQLQKLNDKYTKLCEELGYQNGALPKWQDAVDTLAIDLKEDLFNRALKGEVAIPSEDK